MVEDVDGPGLGGCQASVVQGEALKITYFYYTQSQQQHHDVTHIRVLSVLVKSRVVCRACFSVYLLRTDPNS